MSYNFSEDGSNKSEILQMRSLTTHPDIYMHNFYFDVDESSNKIQKTKMSTYDRS